MARPRATRWASLGPRRGTRPGPHRHLLRRVAPVATNGERGRALLHLEPQPANDASPRALKVVFLRHLIRLAQQTAAEPGTSRRTSHVVRRLLHHKPQAQLTASGARLAAAAGAGRRFSRRSAYQGWRHRGPIARPSGRGPQGGHSGHRRRRPGETRGVVPRPGLEPG